MSVDQLALELTDHLFRKLAEEGTDFADGNDAVKAKDRSQKLRMALIGLGALGAGGLAAWGLSGEAGKQLGAWIGGGAPNPSLGKALTNEVTHGVAAGGAAAALRSGTARNLLGDVDTSGNFKVEPLQRDVTNVGSRIRGVLADSAIAPGNTPDRILADATALRAEPKDVGVVKNLFTPIPAPTDAARAGMKAFSDYTEQGSGKPDTTAPAKSKDPLSKAQVTANLADKSIREGLAKPGSVDNVVNALHTAATNPSLGFFNSAASGLYVQQPDGQWLPVSATQLNPDQLLRSTLASNELGPDGQYKLVPLGNTPPQLSRQINIAENTTLTGKTDQLMTPQQKMNMLLSKQVNAPRLLEYIDALAGSADPKAQILRQALQEELLLTHHIGTRLETGYTPHTDTQPSYDRVINDVRDRVQRRAPAFREFGAAMAKTRYREGVAPAARRFVAVGGATALASAILQQAFGATTGHYLGE